MIIGHFNEHPISGRAKAKDNEDIIVETSPKQASKVGSSPTLSQSKKLYKITDSDVQASYNHNNGK